MARPGPTKLPFRAASRRCRSWEWSRAARGMPTALRMRSQGYIIRLLHPWQHVAADETLQSASGPRLRPEKGQRQRVADQQLVRGESGGHVGGPVTGIVEPEEDPAAAPRPGALDRRHSGARVAAAAGLEDRVPDG